MHYTTIKINKDQIDKLHRKYFAPFIRSTIFRKIVVPRIISCSYISENEKDNGFVTCLTWVGKKVEFKLSSENVASFFEFTGFNNIRYDVYFMNKNEQNMDNPHNYYSDQYNIEFYNLLMEYALKAKKEFWKGATI